MKKRTGESAMMPRGRIAIMAGTDGEHFAQSKTILTGEFMSAAAMVRPSGWWRTGAGSARSCPATALCTRSANWPRAGAASKKAAGHRDRRRRVPPAGQDHRLRALRRQDQASGADTVITGNWGQDLALLIKAAGQAGLNVDWYTFYAAVPAARRPSSRPIWKTASSRSKGINNQGYGPAEKRAGALMERFSDAPVYYPRMFNMMDMVFKAMEEAKSENPGDFVPKLEGMKHDSFAAGDEGFMRSDDHQFFQPLYISTLGALDSGEKFDEEHTGWGWKMAASVPTESTLLSSSCEMARP